MNRLLARAVLTAAVVAMAYPAAAFDEKTALATSQAAIGGAVGDIRFTDTAGREVGLVALQGRPLVVNFVYSSCAHSCGVLTQALADTLDNARDALGADSFNVLTVGFDWANDTPGRMRDFARAQGVAGIANWRFVSGDGGAIASLSERLGFVYRPSPKGFDHLDQVTLIDAAGRIHTQVYGEHFDKPALIEPLKELVLGTPAPYRSLDDLIKKVRLFCTLYDPAMDRYRFDYSLFIQLFAGASIILAVAVIVVRELWRNRRRRSRPGRVRSAL